MKLTLRDGRTVELPFSAANCSGYVATEIVLSAADVRAMNNLFVRDTRQFHIALLQLEARFPENRVNPDIGIIGKTK